MTKSQRGHYRRLGKITTEETSFEEFPAKQSVAMPT